ncbi:hypothetical protein [Nocardia sp. NPDC006630]|uniref:hypothetical protein n=1 Tax=Nocardia sp. NPDC006630 TaxID=3157181 RepID=UPI0033A02602
MLRRNTIRVLLQHALRGLLLSGACASGSLQPYLEWERENPVPPRSGHWDWSVPHRWYDEGGVGPV